MPVLLALFALSLGACSFAPPLVVPAVPIADHYKERGPWTAARPADGEPRERWWIQFDDADLDALQDTLIRNSPDLAAALARYAQAQALSDQARAGLLPTLSLNSNAQRDRQSELRPLRVLGPNSPNDYNSVTLGAQLDYELDFWGRIRNQVVAGDTNAEAVRGDLESARLSLQAQLADSYIALRGLDRTVALLRDAVTAFERALELTTTRHEGGVSSGLDVARAQNQLEATRSQVAQVSGQRALQEHAIAALVGDSASSFSIAPRAADIALPTVPTGVPSALLQRRPDIAAAERRIASATAGIGVARAAFYPAITLSAAGGYQTSDIGSFIAAPNLFWALGPSLLLNVFDFGRRQSEVDRTRAVLDEVGARYRSVVLGAFQQVEDNLALIARYREAAGFERSALAAARKSLDFATLRYREGAVNYLEVTTAQTATLQSERNNADLDTLQRRATVQLIRALGGGWSGGPRQPPVALAAP